MMCKDFFAMPHLGANKALSTELVRIDLLFNKRERNDCFRKFREGLTAKFYWFLFQFYKASYAIIFHMVMWADNQN